MAASRAVGELIAGLAEGIATTSSTSRLNQLVAAGLLTLDHARVGSGGGVLAR